MDNGERELLKDIRERLRQVESRVAQNGKQIEQNETNIEWLIKKLNHTSKRNLAIGTCIAGALGTIAARIDTIISFIAKLF